jgi:Contractile injection system tube protein
MPGMQLEKARIEVVAGSSKGTVVPVLFNPTEYSLERANTYKSTPVPGLGSPLIQFVNGDAETLSMDLFVDDYTDGTDVPDLSGAGAGPPMTASQRIDLITSLLDIDRELHAPPPLLFVWGWLRFTGVLEKVGRKITLFHSNGWPARATLAVAFRRFRPLERQLDEPRRQSADKTKRRQISASDSVWSIADREYGDPRNWRPIASASDVDDPEDLRPGDWVKVPPLEAENGIGRAR